MDGRQLLERYEAGERSFVGAQLEAADLRKADLTGVDLLRAKLAGARLGAAELEEARLVGADLSGADLRDANLQAANLQNANLRGARAQYADLREAMLGHAFLQHADLQHADLRGVDLREAELTHADLRHADLQHADLRSADLTNADLRGADLRSARLRGVDLTGATIDASTLRASHWSPDQLAAVIALGAELKQQQEELTTEMLRVVTGDLQGLTLYFDTELNARDRLTVEAVLVAVLGEHTACRVVEYAATEPGSLLRIGGDDGELRQLAGALTERFWENRVLEGEHCRVPLSEVLPYTDRDALSLLVDRLGRTELWRVLSTGGRPHLDETWELGLTREDRLGTLLTATLGVADLRDWLARGPLGRDATAGLPGIDASARAFGRAAAQALSARDRVDAGVFAHLAEARPERRRDIAFVAALWGLES